MPDDDTTPTSPVVITWEYPDYTSAEWFFATASAYLESGVLIYEQMGQTLPLTYHHARSAKFLCDHALELFFKGTELQALKPLTGTHDLQQLYNEFRGLCPGKQFQFQARINEMVKANRKGQLASMHDTLLPRVVRNGPVDTRIKISRYVLNNTNYFLTILIFLNLS